jgi:hypothetical protein
MKNHHEFVMCELEFRITGLSTRREIARLDGDMGRNLSPVANRLERTGGYGNPWF